MHVCEDLVSCVCRNLVSLGLVIVLVFFLVVDLSNPVFLLLVLVPSACFFFVLKPSEPVFLRLVLCFPFVFDTSVESWPQLTSTWTQQYSCSAMLYMHVRSCGPFSCLCLSAPNLVGLFSYLPGWSVHGCYLPGDGTTSHLATSFLDGLLSSGLKRRPCGRRMAAAV